MPFSPSLFILPRRLNWRWTSGTLSFAHLHSVGTNLWLACHFGKVLLAGKIKLTNWWKPPPPWFYLALLSCLIQFCFVSLEVSFWGLARNSTVPGYMTWHLPKVTINIKMAKRSLVEWKPEASEPLTSCRSLKCYSPFPWAEMPRTSPLVKHRSPSRLTESQIRLALKGLLMASHLSVIFIASCSSQASRGQNSHASAALQPLIFSELALHWTAILVFLHHTSKLKDCHRHRASLENLWKFGIY